LDHSAIEHEGVAFLQNIKKCYLIDTMSHESSSLPETNPISTEAVRNIFDTYVYCHLLGYFVMDRTYFEIHNYEKY